MLLIEHLQEFDIEAFRNELINNIDYITDEKISELQYKAEQIKGMCKAATKYRKRQEGIYKKKIDVKITSCSLAGRFTSPGKVRFHVLYIIIVLHLLVVM